MLIVFFRINSMSLFCPHLNKLKRQGFTLIELSIVLVIIGLVVGGVLAGRNLIHAAEVRAMVTQIEKYKTAVNTFYGKYSYLPGDVPNPTQFGLTTFAQGASCMGNGLIDDYYCHSPTSSMQNGESSLFWIHLANDTHLIEGSYQYTGVVGGTGSVVLGTNLPVLPFGDGIAAQQDGAGKNWFGTGIVSSTAWDNGSTETITAKDAYLIDSKFDDGKPNSGSIQASNTIGADAGAPIVDPIHDWQIYCASDGSVANTPAAVYNTTSAYANVPKCNFRFPIQ